MKKSSIISLGMATALVASSMAVAVSAVDPAPEDKVLKATVLKETVTVDGKLDDNVWKVAEWYDIASFKAEETRVNNTAKFATAWDDTSLYIAVDVKDATIAKENLSSNIYCNDGVEIFIDQDMTRATTNTATTAHLYWEVADGKFSVQGTGWADTTANYPGTNIVAVENDGGYTVELQFSLAELGITAAEGTQFNLDVANNDDDDPASYLDADRVELMWMEYAIHHYYTPATWGIATLGEAAPEYVDPNAGNDAAGSDSDPTTSTDTFDLTAVALAASALSAAAFAVSKKRSK